MKRFSVICVLSVVVLFTSAARPAKRSHSYSNSSRNPSRIERIVSRSYRYTVLVKTRVFIGLGGDQKSTENNPYLGSGMVIDTKRGLILTNRHVVTKSPAEIHVVFHNKEKVLAKRVYLDDRMDIAILKVDPKKVKFKWAEATFQSAKRIRTGHRVGGFGHPLGYEFSLSVGYVAAEMRKQVGYGRFLQLDMAIAGGNSGGPSFSLQTGNVLGMNTYRSAQDNTKMTFALSADDFMDIIREAKLTGKVKKVRRAHLGTQFTKVDDKRLNWYLKAGMPRPPKLFSKGMYVVTHATPGGPATNILKPFDLIYKLGPYYVMEDTIDFVNRYLDRNVGKNVPVVVVRNGAFKKLKLNIEDSAQFQIKEYALASGVAVHNVNPDTPGYALSDQLGVEVTDILDDAQGDRGSLKPYDVIKAVNGFRIRNIRDFVRVLGRVPIGKKAEVLYHRFGKDYNVHFGLSQLEILRTPRVLNVDDKPPKH